MAGQSFHSANNVNHKGATNTWFTPPQYVRNFGEFDLDPCTESFRPFDTAKNHIEHDRGGCGLKTEWKGRVWLNPPYGKGIDKWLNKLADHGNGIALVFARMETRWAQEAMKRCTAVFFISGRISFIKADGSISTNAANGSMYLIWGEDNVTDVLESGINGTLVRIQEQV